MDKLTIGAVLRHKMAVADKKVYWLGNLGPTDNYGSKYGNIMYDAKTKFGYWANMSEDSWKEFGIGKLGIGLGQKYEKQDNGRWLKIEG